jgi:hypothetical protein
LFGEDKEEEVIDLESVDDLYNHAARLKATVSGYVKPTLVQSTEQRAS